MRARNQILTTAVKEFHVLEGSAHRRSSCAANGDHEAASDFVLPPAYPQVSPKRASCHHPVRVGLRQPWARAEKGRPGRRLRRRPLFRLAFPGRAPVARSAASAASWNEPRADSNAACRAARASASPPAGPAPHLRGAGWPPWARDRPSGSPSPRRTPWPGPADGPFPLRVRAIPSAPVNSPWRSSLAARRSRWPCNTSRKSSRESACSRSSS